MEVVSVPEDGQDPLAQSPVSAIDVNEEDVLLYIGWPSNTCTCQSDTIVKTFTVQVKLL